jgi:hypothetical protein
MMNDVSKLDPKNPQLLHLMHRYFSRNMATVDFWLNCCVFPTETKQYPARLARSAWHLADNAHIVGFSGELGLFQILLLGQCAVTPIV